jgi:two-component system, OmpR family, response regulator
MANEPVAMRILLIEDDASVADFISKGLRESQYVVTHARDGREGQEHALKQQFDLMVVDRMLPFVDGITIIESVRRAEIKTPVLILSALGDVDDRVKGLKVGGDDYLVKPFAFAELLARIEALLRRQEASQTQTRLKVADLEMDLLAHKVTRSGKNLNLQPREYKLLEYLMKHAGQVVTRTMLLENVWDYHFDPQTNVIDVHVSRLRQKIDKGFEKSLLNTVRGAGYMLNDA